MILQTPRIHIYWNHFHLLMTNNSQTLIMIKKKRKKNTNNTMLIVIANTNYEINIQKLVASPEKITKSKSTKNLK